jgi:GxxExxY protein
MAEHEPIPAELERIATLIVDAAFAVHQRLGPGLLESVYEECLAYELRKRGLNAARQVVVPIQYDGVVLESTLRLDLLVEDQVIVENKAVEQMIPLFQAQTLTYMKLARKRLGFLINFNVVRIKDGIKRLVN